MNTYLSQKIRILSFVSILLVVILHAYNLTIKLGGGVIYANSSLTEFCEDFLSQGIARIAVPIFFLISGYLFFLNFSGTKYEYKAKIKKRFGSLLLPYLCWSVWGIIFYLILESLPHSETFFTKDLIAHSSPKRLLYILLLKPIPYQLWFIRDLIMLVLLSPIILLIVHRIQWLGCAILCYTWFIDINFILFSNESFLFFVIGATFPIFNQKALIQITIKGGKTLMILWLCTITLRTLLILNLHTAPFILDSLRKISVLLGIASIWILYDQIMTRRTISPRLNKLTSFTFFLYAFHEPILTIVKKGLAYILRNGTLATLSSYVFSVLITVPISIFTGYIIRRSWPRFYPINNRREINTELKTWNLSDIIEVL